MTMVLMGMPGVPSVARTWFLTNGATQGNHALCLALAPLGARIVAQRNSHASVVDGLVLSGGVPSFVAPEYDAELGITHCVTPEALERALAATLDARAAFVVSPTYYGMTADVAAAFTQWQIATSTHWSITDSRVFIVPGTASRDAALTATANRLTM